MCIVIKTKHNYYCVRLCNLHSSFIALLHTCWMTVRQGGGCVLGIVSQLALNFWYSLSESTASSTGLCGPLWKSGKSSARNTLTSRYRPGVVFTTSLSRMTQQYAVSRMSHSGQVYMLYNHL